MRKIKDLIALGTLTGIIGTIPPLILNFITTILGFSQYYSFQLSGSIYINEPDTYTFWGMVLGGVVWEFMAAGLGIATVLLIRKTGKDFWWLKGMIISNMIMFIFIYGFFFALGAPKVVPWDLKTNWSVLIENILFGLTMSYLIIRCGDESMLPEAKRP